MNAKQILSIIFLSIALLTTGSAALAATYDELIAQAEEFERQATLKQIEVDNLCVAEDASESSACKTAKSQLTSLKLQAESRRQAAAAVGKDGKTTEPCEIRGDCPKETRPQTNNPAYKLIVQIPGLKSDTITNPLDYIKGIYNFGIGFGMLIAVAIIIFAGLKWTTSAGNPSAQSEAKDMILNAVFGIVMLLSAILILRTIDPKLATLTLPELKPLAKSSFTFDESEKWAQINKDWTAASNSYKDAQAKADALAKNCAEKKCTTEELAELKQAQIAAQKAKIAKLAADEAIYSQQLEEKRRAYTQALQDEADGFFGWWTDRGEAAPAVIEAESNYNNALKQYEDAKKARQDAEAALAAMEK